MGIEIVLNESPEVFETRPLVVETRWLPVIARIVGNSTSAVISGGLQISPKGSFYLVSVEESSTDSRASALIKGAI